MKVKVEPKHIFGASRGSKTSCPMARALWKTHPGASMILVNARRSIINYERRNVRYGHSEATANAILDFDNGRNMEPGEYEMNFLDTTED